MHGYAGYVQPLPLSFPTKLEFDIPIFADDFDTFSVDHDGATWMREVDMSGFG